MTNEARATFDQVNLVVRDVEAAVAFYRRLGVHVADTEPQWQAQHRNATTPGGIALDFDSADFARTWNRGWPADATGPILGFRLPTREAVDALYADLTSAGVAGSRSRTTHSGAPATRLSRTQMETRST